MGSTPRRTTPIRSGLVDPDRAAAGRLQAAIGASADVEVVAWAATADDLVRLGATLDAVLLVHRPSLDEATVTAALSTLCLAGLRVLVLPAAAGRGRPAAVPAAAPEIVLALRALTRTGGWPPPPPPSVASGGAAAPALSERQRELLVRVAGGGESLPAIAADLGISYDTLKTHLQRIKDKYAQAGRPARTRFDLYHRAREDGYLAG